MEKVSNGIHTLSHIGSTLLQTLSISYFLYPLKPVVSTLLENYIPLGLEIMAKWAVG
jgi:hypothetical protein